MSAKVTKRSHLKQTVLLILLFFFLWATGKTTAVQLETEIPVENLSVFKHLGPGDFLSVQNLYLEHFGLP